MSRLNTTANTVILILSCFMQGQLASAQSKTIEVTDSRPVAKAVEMLEEIYGLSITYEDPITIHESQLQDVTEQVQRIPDPSHRVIVQKDVSISFAYRPISSQSIAEDKTDQSQANTGMIVSDALSSVFAGYANAGGPVTFNVNEENGVFHVIPTNYLNKDGKIEQSTPILDTKITIDPKSRTRVQLLVEMWAVIQGNGNQYWLCAVSLQGRFNSSASDNDYFRLQCNSTLAFDPVNDGNGYTV